MGDGFDFRRDDDSSEDVYSKVVRAGKRTYFFDVKATRGGDYYLTVTESRKRTNRDGSQAFEKNKIFLYKEDFAKFADGLDDAVGYVKTHKPEFFEEEARRESEDGSAWGSSGVSAGTSGRGTSVFGAGSDGSSDLDAEFDRL